MAQAPFQPEPELSPGEVRILEPEINAKREWEQDLNTNLMCRECKDIPPNVVEEFSSGDLVCGTCGLILGERIIDTRSEWRTFSNDDQGNDDPSRVGEAASPFLNGSQLHTSIGFNNGDARSKDLNRAQSKNVQNKSDKALQTAYGQISRFCEKLDVTMVVNDSAKQILKQAVESNLFKNKNQDALIASCIFVACRLNSVGRTFREVFNVTNVSKKEIGRTFKLLEDFLRQEKNRNPTMVHGILVDNSTADAKSGNDPIEQVRRYGNQLGLAKTTIIYAEKLLVRVNEIGILAGRSPLSVAAAVLFFVSHLMGEPKQGKDIAPLIHVSEGTIRTAYKLLYNKREDLVDKARLGANGKLDLLPVG